MGFTIYVGEHTVDLGQTFDVLRRFADLGRLDPSDSYPALMGLVHAGGEDLDPEYATQVAREAGRFQAQYHDRLTPQLRQFLGALAMLSHEDRSLKRTYVEPYTRRGRLVSGYWRDGDGGGARPDLDRNEFAKLLNRLPVGTRFTLKPENHDVGYWSLRGTWEKVELGGLPYWFNAERGLHRAASDFHLHAARHVLEALGMRKRDSGPGYRRAKPAQEFTLPAQAAVDRGLFPAAARIEPSLLTQREVKSAFATIDKVHRVLPTGDPPPKLPIIDGPQDQAFPHDLPDGSTGSYTFDTDGDVATPSFLWVSPGPHPAVESIVTHEFWHYLDQQIFGGRETFGSRQATGGDGYGDRKYEHRLRPIMDAISRTDYVATLMEHLHDDTPRGVRLSDGTVEVVAYTDPEKRMHTHYLLQPPELTARAYTQWIALRSDNKRMLGHVEEMSAPDRLFTYQWQWDDFEPVAEAFDKTFGDLGWLPEGRKATTHVEPYMREGRPVSGYERQVKWQPTMTVQEADRWAADSAWPGWTWHSTFVDKADAIKREGFRPQRVTTFGRVWATGHYFAANRHTAATYDSMYRSTPSGFEMVQTLPVRLHVRQVLDLDVSDLDTAGVRSFGELPEWASGKLGRRGGIRFQERLETIHQRNAEILGRRQIVYNREFPTVIEQQIGAANFVGKDELAQEGFEFYPPQRAFADVAREFGYDAIHIHGVRRGDERHEALTGGEQLIVFDTDRIAVVDGGPTPEEALK